MTQMEPELISAGNGSEAAAAVSHSPESRRYMGHNVRGVLFL